MGDDGSRQAGWHPDPQGRHDYRYHDGNGWTDDVSDAGAASKDPLVVSTGAPTPARSRRVSWLVGGLGAALAAVIVVIVFLVAGGDDGSRADPLVGVYEGGGDQADVTLIVSGDPPSLTELSVAAACGRVSSSQTIEFSPLYPIEDGQFEVSLPPPGAVEIDGTFVDGGRRVEGHVVAGGCDEDWAAELLSGDDRATGRVQSTNAVEWVTPDATLTADNFYVTANGLVFTAAVTDVDVHGDAADGGDDTTIEVRWFEHDREMRVFIYLESDSEEWWVYEIRAYDGLEDPDWVYFEDRYLATPLGETFEADVFELEGVAEDSGATVVVHFDGLRVETTLEGGDDDTSEPTVPDDDTSAPTVPDDDTSEPTVPDDDTSEPTVPDDGGDGGVPVDETVFRDDFDGTLDAGWRWLNEDPDRWTLDTRPGWLSIAAQDVQPTGISNILVRPAEIRDDTRVVVVTTRVAFEPSSNFQFAGLVVTGPDADGDRVQFGRAYCDAPVCVGDGLYLDRVEGGDPVGENFAIPFENTPELYLQLIILPDDPAGTTVFAGFSFDGDEWFEAGGHTVDFAITDVGLIAHQAPQEITASFDFVELTIFTG